MNKGILVGANERQEWLLPWWWSHFTKHSRLPVCFADFGLSASMKNWCRERGTLLSISKNDLLIKDRDEVDALNVEIWEKRYPDTFWDARKAWFKKPLACLHTPFLVTAWIDLDCEIVGSLDALFKYSGVAVAKDQSASTYNSGVIVFAQKHPLIVQWAEQSLIQNGAFRGDQDLLSHLIQEGAWKITPLPPQFNWAVGYGKRQDIVIYHWLGDAAKAALRNEITLNSFEF